MKKKEEKKMRNVIILNLSILFGPSREEVQGHVVVAEEAAARALDFEPAARHRGVVVVVIAAVVVATAAVVVVVAVTEELFLIFSATEDSEFPRIATFLISS